MIFTPGVIHTICKFLYNVLKILLAIDVIGIKSFDQLNDFSNEIDSFIAIFYDGLFSGLNILCKN